jgi:hypothetical protein
VRVPSYRTSLILLLIGAFFLRLGWVLHLSVDESALRVLPDQVEYLELGRNLLQKHSLEFHDERFDQTVRAYRTPGYPLLIAVCGANLRFIRIVQTLIDTSTVLAAYLLARKWLSPGASLFAGFIVAVNPFLIYFAGLILSETLFIAMLAWGMAMLCRFTGPLLLALSVMVRPSAVLLPLVLPMARRGTGWKPVLQGVCATCVILTIWGFRNHRVLDHWIFSATDRGITLYDGFNARADGSSDQSFIYDMPQLWKMSEVERSAYLAQRAREFALAHPATVLRLTLQKIARTWSPIPLSTEYGSRRMYVAVAACYSIPLDLLVLLGLWSGSLPRAAKVYLMIPAIYFTLAHGLSVGSLRYRIPAEVPMAVVAASWLTYIAPRMRVAK